MIVSLIDIFNKRGPTFEPCDTPVLIDTIEELISPICTYCLRLDRWFLNKALAEFLIP